jgi:putative radical SAM enzyme (TIGR03279 family)
MQTRQVMNATIASVAPDSPADALGLRPGDIVLAVNGNAALEDMFDYQFETADVDTLELRVRHADGAEKCYELEKEPDEDPGIVFTSPVFTPIRTCNNACPFCFIDQQPDGLRPSLYIKDDDYRLSYFANTYITLTNLTPRDRERIGRLRPGPLYVSVHSTVPEVRRQALINPKGGNILEELRWLKSLEVPFHCQIVVCPGLTDGDSLRQSLEDLHTLRPEALSVAVVPVGLTRYRDNLSSLKPVEADSAERVIEIVDAFKATHADAADFVFLSDEFYFKAGRSLPSYSEYGDFPQLDDGVGTARMLLEDFFQRDKDLPASVAEPFNILLLTAKLGAMILQPVATRLNAIDGLYVDVLAVQSGFWGDSVDVAGLVTGEDIVKTLSAMDLSGYRSALIPSVMLKQSTESFLDGKTVSEVAQQVNLPFQVVQDPYSAQELMTHIFNPPAHLSLQRF